MAENATVKVNEKLTLYRRERSKRWQARLLLQNGEWHRFSTKTTDLDEAKEFALKQFYTADYRKKNNLGSRFECSTKYLSITSSVTFPLVVEKYPRGQNRLPPYLFSIQETPSGLCAMSYL